MPAVCIFHYCLNRTEPESWASVICDRLGFPVFPLSGTTRRRVRFRRDIGRVVIFRSSHQFPRSARMESRTEQELFNLDEQVQLFDITKCKAGARFDFQKGIWFNHEYMLRKSDEEIAADFASLSKTTVSMKRWNVSLKVVSMMKDRVNFFERTMAIMLVLLWSSYRIRWEDRS